MMEALCFWVVRLCMRARVRGFRKFVNTIGLFHKLIQSIIAFIGNHSGNLLSLAPSNGTRPPTTRTGCPFCWNYHTLQKVNHGQTVIVT